MKLKERYKRVINYFLEHGPKPETELEYTDPFELIVAVILSAQCTDKRVNMITPALLKAFPDAKSMASASQEEIFSLIRSCSYPNSKARYLRNMSAMLCEKFGGIVPDDPELLRQLPGVGRKTANVVASVVYHKPVMAVDTHVFRVSKRIGLTPGARNPAEAEDILTENIPSELIPDAHHWLILHGRYVCIARKPHCDNCGVKLICNYFLSERKKELTKQPHNT